MKIGILTYQYAMNYGALLQAYALKTYLENIGHTVEILNYDTSYLYAQNRSLKSKIVSNGWNIVKNMLGAKKKKQVFDKFRQNYLRLNDYVIRSKEELKKYLKGKGFDAFIVGSDQVWNPEINGKDDTYYLNFTDRAMKISYAASFGVSSLNQEDLNEIIEYLKTFSAISVREKTGMEILKELDKGIEVVLDPVFLPHIETWNKLAGMTANINGKYMLCYVMPGDKELESKIEELARQYKRNTGNQVIFLGRKEYKKFKKDGRDLVSTAPWEFVNLFKNADVIVTNSFHGTAFSIIFNKLFYSLINRNLKGTRQLGSRLTDLLAELELECRIVALNDQISFDKDINYSIVNSKLEKMRHDSRQFLERALQ